MVTNTSWFVEGIAIRVRSKALADSKTTKTVAIMGTVIVTRIIVVIIIRLIIMCNLFPY